MRVLPRLAALCTPASRNRAGDQATHDQHDKFAIFDGRLLVTGSYNWTSSAEAWNYENALFLDDPALITRYAVRFERLLAGPAVTPTGR